MNRSKDWLNQALRDMELAQEAQRMGRHEYPNSHPEGAPFEHYGPIQSEQAINYAREVVEFVRSKMAR